MVTENSSGRLQKDPVKQGLTAVIILTILFCILILYQVFSHYRSDHYVTQEARNSNISQEINNFINPFMRGARVLAETSTLKEFAAGLIEAGDPSISLALKLSREALGADCIFVLDPEGTVMTSTEYEEGRKLVGNNYSFRPYFTGAMQGREMVYPAHGVTTGKSGFYFSSPVVVQKGTWPGAVVVIKAGLQQLEEIMDRHDEPVMLVSLDGVVFASNIPGYVFHYGRPIDPAKLEEIAGSRQFGNNSLKSLSFMFDQKTVKLNGASYSVLSKPLNIEGWQLVTLSDFSVPQNLIIVSMLIFIGFILLAFLAARNLMATRQRNISEARLENQYTELQQTNQQLIEEILQREKGEEEILQQRAFLANLLESLTFPFYVIDAEDYTIKQANSAAMTNELQADTTCYALTHNRNDPCTTENHPCPLAEVKRTGKSVAMEHVHYDKDGSPRNVEVHGYPIKDKSGKVVQMIEFCLDITKRKQAEKAIKESEERLKTILDSIQAGIVLIDAKTHEIMEANPVAIDMIQAPKEDIIGSICHRFICPAKVDECPITDLGYEVDNAERTLLTSSGKKVPILKTVIPISLNSRQILLESFVDISQLKQAEEEINMYQSQLEELVEERTAELLQANRDLETEVTERRRAEEVIKASLQEKEVMLSEIHHRVKNNMQVISSLLKLQSKHIKEAKYVEMVRESQYRIQAMALLHEKLYKSKDLANINFRDYLNDLTVGLFRFYGVHRGRISLKIECVDVMLSLNQAIPCGLIINELISNSLKHAFGDEAQGEVSIDCRVAGGDMIIRVADNGCGIPEDFDIRKSESLGLRLVTMLTEDQLQGTLEVARDHGTVFEIRFQKSDKN